MDRNKIVIIAPVAVAGILILGIVAAISSTNQALAAATTAGPHKPTTLTLQVHTSTKTLGKVSDMVPLTISGKLWTKDFSRAIPRATIKISCDGKECGTSDTDSNGHYSVSVSLNAIPPNSTNTIEASTEKTFCSLLGCYVGSETSQTIQLCENPDYPGYWSFCGPTTTK